MKPYPFSELNHLTVPTATTTPGCSILAPTVRGLARNDTRPERTRGVLGTIRSVGHKGGRESRCRRRNRRAVTTAATAADAASATICHMGGASPRWAASTTVVRLVVAPAGAVAGGAVVARCGPTSVPTGV